ncbi:MAG: hypothetical protein AB7P20_26130, partial [Rhizobiaceae bacterium]
MKRSTAEQQFIQAADAETAEEAEDRRRKLATWKFDLLETVSADPLCNGHDVEIILAYIRFMDSRDARPFRSNIQLQAATGLSQPTIADRRKKLVALGYLTADGQTASGVTRFKISNPRENTVLDHVQITNEVLKRQDAERRETERRKRKSTEPKGASGVKETYTPGAEGVKEIWGTGYKNLMTTTYSEYVEDLGSEERDNPLKVSTGLPYPVPAS